MTRPWTAGADHVSLAVRLTPKSGRDAIDGVEADAEGRSHLKVRVTSIAEKGKANKALIAVVAESVGLAKSSVGIISGEASRKKILRIEGDPEDVIKKLDALAGL
ncbi:DUF167 domain-containing protein [Rhizobium sp. Root1220]|uniref:DUF167 domain-containing protein n=1 Tax=Rhizobium sp. Root1220 TaxID=1736432 RepID=UPI0006FF8712|nr:DUF167 domain-containing protein [Rhizobium sp. Root1220]KQV73182.1 hypothetical protein ASC90_07185 [Rhizobium sp. Root1220]